MHVAVLTDEQTLEKRDRPKPNIDNDEVLVKMQEVGICGSDVHFYEHGRIGDNVVTSPLVLGHESAGKVSAVGDAVTGLEPGDPVALEPGVPCRRCKFCKRGDYQLCQNVTFMAAPPDDGAFAEYVAWPADFVYKLPDEVSIREGALCEPLSVGVHACRRGDVSIGDTVVITGAGPVGLLTMEAAKAAGASDILVSDVVSEKLSLAAERGADRVIDDSTTDVEEAVAEYTDGSGADVVVEASGAEPAAETVVDLSAPGANVVMVGLTDEAVLDIDAHKIIRNEIDFRGSFRYSNTYDAAIDLIADDAVDVTGIVDFEYPFDDLDSAFQHALDPTSVKGIVTVRD